MKTAIGWVVMAAAAAGCAAESEEPEVWPCGSWSEHTATGPERTYRSYAWDEHHNLIRDRGPGQELRTWAFDPTGTIALEETDVSESGEYRTHVSREAVDGQVMRELRTIIGPQQREVVEVVFRYEGGRLVEKVAGEHRTTITYPAPDTRVEADARYRNTYVGEPWTRLTNEWIGVGFGYEDTRELDDHGLVIRFERRDRPGGTPFIVEETERTAYGAPLVQRRTTSTGVHTTTYLTTCEP